VRCVLDTNIVLSGLLWNGAPRQFLKAAQQDSFELFTSALLIDELADVLSRRKCAKRLREMGLTAEQILMMYSRAASLVNPVPVPRLAPDPDDDAVIGTAIAAKAVLIVTGDKPLLSVGVYEGGRIVTVTEALALAEAASQEGP
jgi:hypothetical protein